MGLLGDTMVQRFRPWVSKSHFTSGTATVSVKPRSGPRDRYEQWWNSFSRSQRRRSSFP